MPVIARWIAPLALAFGLGAASLMPAPARASDDLVRVIVDAADVILRGGAPHYRHGGYDDRLIVERDRYGRPVYYRCRAEGGFLPDPDEIEANVEKVRGLVLRTEFVKKA